MSAKNDLNWNTNDSPTASWHMKTPLHNMNHDPLTNAQFSHAVRSEVQWLLSDPEPPQTHEENSILFRARLEKSLKETGGYGQLIIHCDDKLEAALQMVTKCIQSLIMEVMFEDHHLADPARALTTLEAETTKIIDDA